MNTTLQNESTTTPTTERTSPGQYVAPHVNIYETKDGYTLEAEMPGVGKDGLEITLEGHDLTIVGRRAPEVVSGKTLFRERTPVDYQRAFELDPAIDTARISARMNQGVLVLTLPKSEQVKPRKISIGE